MGRMDGDGDGIDMGNEFVAAPVGSAMAVESQHDEIQRLRREVESLKLANDRVQAERDTAQAEAHGWCVAFDEKAKELAKVECEVDRLRHQTREARTQPARSAEVEMYRRALRALIELL